QAMAVAGAAGDSAPVFVPCFFMRQCSVTRRAGSPRNESCPRRLLQRLVRRLLALLSLIWNLGLDEFRQKGERFLPTETASLGWNDIREPLLRDIQLSSAGHLLQDDRRLHLAGQVRIVELIRVANALVWQSFEIVSTEGVAAAGAEVRERHLVDAADFGVQMVNLARKSLGRKPFG